MSAESAAEHCDVAVVGAGPAGLGCATRLRALGLENVRLLDREPDAGGIPRHCGHYPFGVRELHRLLRGPDYARGLVERARGAGVDIRTGCTVAALEAGPRLVLSTDAGRHTLQARRVVLATGVRESSRAARMLGGQRPQGVISTGALQSMVYLQGLRPFRRPLILGTELVSFSSILTCREAGIRPVAMVEEGRRVSAPGFARGLPMALRIPVMLGTTVERIVGARRVEAVVLRDPDGQRREVDCDGVIVSGRFMPEASLARSSHLAVDGGTGGPAVDQYGRCSDETFFAAGNLLRPVETAGWSWREGVRSAEWVARSLRGELAPATASCHLSAEGDVLRYVMPQRLALPDAGGGMTHAQVRVSRAASGRLGLHANGDRLWSRRVSALPERRILLPLAPLRHAAAGSAFTVAFEAET